jgi:2-keto-4-pentenoate hydratase/2-oxohepta-3-ene-1,7-dioic acid hydratase in catechol pathway
MFTPKERDLERGWPGRIDGDRVVQLAAQTLQAFFTGGGSAREHDVYALDDVFLRAPVLHPPAVRIFDGDDFAFANPASIHGPEQEVALPHGADAVEARLRLAVVVGASVIGGFTLMNDWHAPVLGGAKASDFATTLGPVVLTPDDFDGGAADWHAVLDHVERNTRLLPGDVIAGPVLARSGPYRAGETVEIGLDPFGVLRSYVAAPS